MKIPGDSTVPNKINGLETKPARIAAAPAVARRGGEAPAPSGAPTDSGTDVHLTGAARGLAAIEQSLRAQPAIDETRVAAVKERLASGSYEVDPQRVADKLLRLDSDLTRAAPLNKNPLR
jgi:negative regulator of flagellin synthesis FlgM